MTAKERPILFSAPMVRAILAEPPEKTETRRVVKDPGRLDGLMLEGEEADWCPYGAPGDRLWVRERMRVIRVRTHPEAGFQIRVRYEADGAESGWLPYPDRLKGAPVRGKCLAYGGYREASRITLEVTGVRVERVQEITTEDALAEGVTWEMISSTYTGDGSWPQEGFHSLWDSINAKRGFGWDVNPWVWVVAFRRIEP